MNDKKKKAMEEDFKRWFNNLPDNDQWNSSERLLAQAAFEAGFQSGSDFLD